MTPLPRRVGEPVRSATQPPHPDVGRVRPGPSDEAPAGALRCRSSMCYKMSHVTRGNRMKLPPLGDLEHELLAILWANGEMTALEVRQHVARKLKDPTIRTVLRRLEEKGYVTHTVASGTFIYRASESAETTAAS